MYNDSDNGVKKHITGAWANGQCLQFFYSILVKSIYFLLGFLGAMVVVLDASNYWFHKSLL